MLLATEHGLSGQVRNAPWAFREVGFGEKHKQTVPWQRLLKGEDAQEGRECPGEGVPGVNLGHPQGPGEASS